MSSARPVQKGFTIVELLIVIVVIAILAAISIVAYNGLQTRAKVAKATSDITTLNKAIVLARINQNKTLFAITGNTGASQNYVVGGTHKVLYEDTIDKISAASGADLSFLKKGDPWGNEYYINENEGETTPCNAYGKDVIKVSPDRSDTPTIYVDYYNCS